MSDALSIQVDHAYKRYSESWVLKGLNMAVPKASIYALLGPSGCGKSTLLTCIVGKMSLDSGAIAVNCEKRSQLGFMPQTVALYLTMTISETFTYYGRMGNMSKQQIAERTSKLAALLELPPLNRVVDTLSGGQQRRISLSVSLINDPKLLLLDEPTVGLDPVLSHSIWNHLVKLAKEEKKTIVITTHYIEEARQATTVGLMRGGVLLCEETPENLLKNNNCDTMEQVFLKLSAAQETLLSNNNNYYDQIAGEKSQIMDTRKSLQRDEIFSIPYLHAEVTKNLIFIWRNKPMLGLLVLLPLIVSYLFHFTLGPEPQGIQLAVINDELSDEGIAMCFNQRFSGCNASQPISCRVIREIRKMNIQLVEFKSWSVAMQAARDSSSLWGVLQVPANYSENLVQRFDMNLNTPKDIADKSEFYVWLDNSNYFIGKFIEIYIHQGFFKGVESFFKDCGWSPRTFDIPIHFEEPVHGAAVPNMRHYVSPPLIILVIFYLPMAYTMGVLIQEKLTGVMERSMVAGLKLREVLAGHFVVQIGVLFIQTLVIIATIYFYHQHPLMGSLFWTTWLLLLQGLSGVTFGFVLAGSVQGMYAGVYLSMGILLTYFFLSGSLWPQEGLYYMLQWFRPVIPISYSVEALRGLSARGWPISHPIVYKGFISVIAWTFGYLVIAMFIEKLKKLFSRR